MTEMMTMQATEIMRKHLEEAGEDQLREMVRFFAEALMGAEAESLCGAGYGERSADRVNSRNGYRTRRWDTRVGTIQLAIPKLRQGSYFPDWLLEPRRRSERALISVVAECYVKGVSTRKVDQIVQQLGIEGIGKSQVSELAKSLDEQVVAFRTRPLEAQAYPYLWFDALYVKSREDGRIANIAVIVAIGVNDDGHREVLGVDIVTTENEAAWSAFLRELVARGLSGVKLVISDAHEGLKLAIGKVLHGASWQRCRTHFMRNLLCKVPKSAQSLVATLVRGIFAQSDADQVWAVYAQVVEKLEEKFAEAAKLLDHAGADLLAFSAFPKEHWKQIWSNNPLERLNKELRRRSDVVGIFPNRAAVIRLLGAVLAEQNDEWVVARRYLTIGSLDELVRKTAEPNLDEQEKPLAMSA
jgi:transposase-like protein